MKFKKRAIYHLCLLCICILCIVSIYYWRQHTMYTYPNEEVYISKIFENEIFVKGLPYQQGTWEEEYINNPGASTQALCSAPTSPLTALAFCICFRNCKSGVC